MNLSDTSSIVTIALGIPTVCIWLWGIHTWFRKRRAHTAAIAEEGHRLAHQLLSQATSPAKRADIHLFMTLRAIEFRSRQTQGTIWAVGTSGITVSLLLFWVLSTKLIDIDYSHPLAIALILSVIGLLATFAMFLVLSSELRKIEAGWEGGTMKAISEKIERYTTDI